MSTNEYTTRIIRELDEILAAVDEQSVIELIEKIKSAKRIYLAGAGRSLLMIRSFAMRLMHLGYETYVVGDTTTPAVEAGDLVIFGSGSGETGALKTMAEKARGIGATIALVTYSPKSTIGETADVVVEIPIGIISNKLQPAGSSFEQSMLILFDALVLSVYRDEYNEQDIDAFIKIRHANLE